VQVFSGRFRGLDGQAVGEVGFGIVACRLHGVEALGGFQPNGHHLEGDHVHLAGVDAGEVVGEGQVVTIGLAGEGEAEKDSLTPDPSTLSGTCPGGRGE
jgi:hypothetical protein